MAQADQAGLKVVGAGLSRTGTTSLTRALQILGMRALHYDQIRLRDVIYGRTANPDFRRYDDYDAILDLPTALFWRELLDAYPKALCILTVRSVDSWWHSMCRYYELYSNNWERYANKRYNFVRDVRNMAYGSYVPREYIYKKKYLDHVEQVLTTVPKERLLVMDIIGGDQWDMLCPFVGKSVPDVEFPFLNAIGQRNDPVKSGVRIRAQRWLRKRRRV